MSVRRGNLYVWLCTACLLVLIGAGVWLFAGLPSPEDLRGYTTAPSSKIFDRSGRLLYEMPPAYTGFHSPVPLDEIPLALQQATLATEDANFYQNPGFDLRGVLRALWRNWRGGEVVMGGSTITQQLVRILMLSPEERLQRTAARKLREIALAVRVTQRYTKDEILSFYLNEVYYGSMAYGAEAAAQVYFGKSVRELDLAECALLAGLPQAPVAYNPLEHLEAAQARQAVVLDRMVAEGLLDAEAAALAQAEPLYFASSRFEIRAPHFVMAVRSQLEQQLGRARLESGGLRVTTTLDVDLNETARDLIRHRLSLLATCGGQQDCPPGGHNVRNAALVAMEPATGQVLAMVGSPDYFAARIAGAVNGTLALRQPGSSIKPVTYAAAFERGALTPAAVLQDERTAFSTREGRPYVPLNYDLRFHGPVRARVALAASYNIPAVIVLDRIGIPAMTGLARRLGITTLDDADRLGLAVTLGGGEVRLLEETAAYAAFANGGHVVQPVLVLRVEDEAGQVLWESPSGVGAQVLDPRAAYLITDILSDDLARSPTFGEGSVLALSRPAAVKTGTTTDFRDNWTVGYTPELVAGVWVGNADNEAMKQVSGVSGAGPIWHDFMEAALQGRPVQDFERPPGLVEVAVCARSGLLPGPDCLHRVRELFIAGTEPRISCDVHGLPEDALASADGLAGALVLRSPDPGAVYRIDPGLPAASQRLAVAARGAGVAEVTLWVDETALARFEAPPYEAFWALAPGEHSFRAEGITVDGLRVATEPVTVYIEE